MGPAPVFLVLFVAKKAVKSAKAKSRGKPTDAVHPIDALIAHLSATPKTTARVEKQEVIFLVCLKCGFRNPGEANYCMKCGQKLK